MRLLAPILLVALAAQQPSSAPGYDVILRHGTVIDGSGLAPYAADVAIAGGFIAKVGNLARAQAKTEIDAARLYVTPGFINIHSHAVPSALARAENMLTQGVTTEILNADGGGAVDLPKQLADAAAQRLAVNIGAYIGFNSIWTQVVGEADRRPTAVDIARMQDLVTAGLKSGAWGVSAGLDYKPAYFAQLGEVVQVVQPAKPWRTNFPNHDRLTPESNFSSRAGITETIAIGEQAGLVPVVTHMKAQGPERGTAAALVALMDAATRRGHYTAADAYPYTAGQTGLGALIIPAWAQEGGREKMLARFRDPALRPRIVAEAEQTIAVRWGGAASVYLPATRHELTDVMKEMNVSAGEAVVRLLEEGTPGVILRFGTEPDVLTILKHPATSIACDCGASTEARTHPRYYGTFPRVLGRYVRETHALTWEDAVRKMTALPANTIGMVDRGYIEPGMAADITVFDPETVIDRATYDDPAQPAEGIRFVLVNGTIVLRDGKVTGEQGGRVLSRMPQMPSRPMSSGPQRLTVNATAGDLAITAGLTQAAGARHASGTVHVRDSANAIEYDAVELGTVQSSTNWSSVTGRFRERNTDREHAFALIVDGADPFAAAGAATVLLTIDGELRSAAIK